MGSSQARFGQGGARRPPRRPRPRPCVAGGVPPPSADMSWATLGPSGPALRAPSCGPPEEPAWWACPRQLLRHCRGPAQSRSAPSERPSNTPRRGAGRRRLRNHCSRRLQPNKGLVTAIKARAALRGGCEGQGAAPTAHLGADSASVSPPRRLLPPPVAHLLRLRLRFRHPLCRPERPPPSSHPPSPSHSQCLVLRLLRLPPPPLLPSPPPRPPPIILRARLPPPLSPSPPPLWPSSNLPPPRVSSARFASASRLRLLRLGLRRLRHLLRTRLLRLPPPCPPIAPPPTPRCAHGGLRGVDSGGARFVSMVPRGGSPPGTAEHPRRRQSEFMQPRIRSFGKICHHIGA